VEVLTGKRVATQAMSLLLQVVAALAEHVSGVVLRSADEQVRWVTARRVVAMMANKHAGIDRPDMKLIR
jgi:hypothetical protein